MRLSQTLSIWLLPVRRGPIHVLSALEMQALDKKTFAPDPSNVIRDAADCGECSALAGVGEQEKGVLYFIKGQRDYCDVEDMVGLLAFGVGRVACRVLKVVGTFAFVGVAVVCMPVYCALWPQGA